MGTLVLRSNDPLRRHKLLQSPKPNPRSNSFRPRRRRRSPTAGRRILVPENPSPSPAKNLEMGQVRILKRGENLVGIFNPKAEAGADLDLSSADWIGPDPDVVRRNVRVSDLYAGAACLPSPPPSSLPFPAMLVRGGARRVI